MNAHTARRPTWCGAGGQTLVETALALPRVGGDFTMTAAAQMRNQSPN
jgi:hypothetical protein